MKEEEGVDRTLWESRVLQSFRVVDAILRGHLLPDPDAEEQASLGVADFDPELRYRVAKDVLEQHYGKARQHVEVEGTGAPLTLRLPDWVSSDVLEGSFEEVKMIGDGESDGLED